ncbi:MAG: bifunctional YncE family protein/alkaline phosphatase family protein, partial [Candidatus Eremiobacteraeota bacterium]|nr:bifunctional YncE family protein/alkaline phosphatase family protein [Candidatus Eremiobacteraeota bacterium]
PNGWRISPAGSAQTLGTLPLHVVEDPSGHWLATVNGGFGALALSIVEESSGRVVTSAPLTQAFYGVVFSHDGHSLYVATADGDAAARFSFDPHSGAIKPAGEISLGHGRLWIAGLAIASDGHTLYAAANGADSVIAVDPETGVTRWAASVGSQPYAVALSKDEKSVYVTNWAAASLSVLDATNGAVRHTLNVCAHPNAEMLSADGKSLYVACANDDRIAVVDTASDAVRAFIDAAIYPHSLPGAIPNGLALSADGKTLFVADAGENAVASIDVSKGQTGVSGAIPVGWYPTDVLVSQDGARLFVLDGKGLSGHANPAFPHSDVMPRDSTQGEGYYVAALANGDLESMAVPAQTDLATGLNKARSNGLYGAAGQLGSAMPRGMHVIYVIKENRTYDEVLGDDPRGNGDSRLTIFGRRVTPNIHRLAQSFVLLDNFDTNALVSADGHNWSTAAYASDYVDKTWPAEYAGRGRKYDYEEAGPASPPGGYLWDAAHSANVSFRDYGEFVTAAGPTTVKAAVPSLGGLFDPNYRGFDLHYSDQDRISEWLREFHGYVSRGDLPSLEIVRLPNDHTAATLPGAKTPFAMLADNDYALGRLVDAVSHSRFWRDTVIFVVEDDAQAGPDHVSDQRAEALIIGARIRRGTVDHTHYTTTSALRSIELLLGMKPMSQFDAGATPMLTLLTSRPDTHPWNASRPFVDLNAVNPASAADAAASLALDLDHADSADPVKLNAILYRFARRH